VCLLGEASSQVIWASHDQGPGLIDRLGAFSCGAAPGDHQRTDRLHGAIPSLRRTADPAGLGGPGGADGVQRAGLALPAAILAVRTADPDDPDTGCSDVASQAGAVAAGALNPGQAHGPEPAQPLQEPGVAGRAGREFPDAKQPSDGIERGGDMHVGMSACTAGNCTCLYDGQCHLYSEVEGVAHTRWPSDL
jgi:hypothetical protein